MPEENQKIIWTIGHSTHSIEEFVEMLKSFHIQLVADIRTYPGSARYPHFNKESLEISLPQNYLEYIHIPTLGGRRKAIRNSINTAWRNASFRGYADYMETQAFQDGAQYLQELAARKRTAFMCSEAVWWRCHRSMVSDYLKIRGWIVVHILAKGKKQEHPYTSAATVVNGQLSYKSNELF